MLGNIIIRKKLSPMPIPQIEPAGQTPFIVPALRTPTQFLEAIDRSLEITREIVHFDDQSNIDEMRTLLEAIKAAPFRFRNGKVAPRGFDAVLVKA